MSETEAERLARLDERVKDLEEFKKDVGQDLKDLRRNSNVIMSGIVVACILLAINMALR